MDPQCHDGAELHQNRGVREAGAGEPVCPSKHTQTTPFACMATEGLLLGDKHTWAPTEVQEQQKEFLCGSV